MSGFALARFEAARLALREAKAIDEVKDLRDKAEAMAAYARQARDTELIRLATEIKVRAERKVGELLRETERNTGVRVRGPAVERCDRRGVPALADLGLTKSESSCYQRLAAMPEQQFEAAIETAKAIAGQVTTARMLREASKFEAPKAGARTAKRGTPRKSKAAQRARERLKDAPHSALVGWSRQVIAAVREATELHDEERQVLAELFAVLSPLLAKSPEA